MNEPKPTTPTAIGIIVRAIIAAFLGGALGTIGAYQMDPTHFNFEHMASLGKVAFGGGVIGVIKYLLYLYPSPMPVKPQDPPWK